jgi:inorganic pyrophosphatase/exopolyphosphatase
MKNKTTNNKKKVVIKKLISLPRYVTLQNSGSFRVRKQKNGKAIVDVTFSKLIDAKAYIKMNNWK